ncbi:MAG: BON domain-containing protein [Thiogranum sp.]|nr:BON domain-containing protein [Thiogranum sp.]
MNGGQRETNATGHEDLITSIYAALVQDTRINLTNIQLDIRPVGKSLELHGKVENIVSKRILANIARQIGGNEFEVVDRLRVNTQDISDAELRDKVAEALLGEPVFGEYSISVVADGNEDLLQDPRPAAGNIQAALQDGVVTLSGEVWSITHMRLAEVVLWWIPGCQRIDNQLRVLPAESDSDDELTDAVKIVLEKDPLVHAGQLRVGTAAGVVELDGQLPSEDEHMLALLDTWAVPGVWEVYDRIEVGRGLG